MKKKDLLKKLEELESRVAALESELERARQKPDVVMPYISTGTQSTRIWSIPTNGGIPIEWDIPTSTQEYIISSDPTV